jgi:hypothetical protein
MSQDSRQPISSSLLSAPWKATDTHPVDTQRWESLIKPPIQPNIKQTLPCSEPSLSCPPEDGGGGDWGGCEAKHFALAAEEPIGVGPVEEESEHGVAEGGLNSHERRVSK